MSVDDDRANRLLDTLTLELLDLIEQQVRCQLDIEESVVSGQLFVAKTRYTLGKNAVSSAQLPTEHSNEFDALVTTTRSPADAGTDLLANGVGELALQRSAADKSAGRPDPLQWFGILLPQSMHGAQRMFARAIECSVQCANIQRSLHSVMQSIVNLRLHPAASTST